MSGVLWRSLRVPLSRRMTRQMADHPTAEELGLTGWQYYFNTQTIAGRRNKMFSRCGRCGNQPINNMRIRTTASCQMPCLTVPLDKPVVFAVYGTLFGIVGLFKLRSKPKKEVTAQ